MDLKNMIPNKLITNGQTHSLLNIVVYCIKNVMFNKCENCDWDV